MLHIAGEGNQGEEPVTRSCLDEDKAPLSLCNNLT